MTTPSMPDKDTLAMGLRDLQILAELMDPDKDLGYDERCQLGWLLGRMGEQLHRALRGGRAVTEEEEGK